ncbi:MAG: ABC transporter permease [Eubacteriales bacterium]|jgi:simple sugar transport system permease protein|nr:ABC transporter permease [Eubacteriales bacterium]
MASKELNRQPQPEKKNWFTSIWRKPNIQTGFRNFISGFICIAIGYFIALILLLCIDSKNAGKGIIQLITAGWGYGYTLDASTQQLVFGRISEDNLPRIIYLMTPMMLTGLTIAFPFQLGLFNIGNTSQITIGAFVGLCLGIAGFPWWACLIFAGLAGALVGFIPGLLKAKLNVNEVLSGIMLNWIIYYLIDIIGRLGLPRSFKDRTQIDNLIFMPTDARMPAIGTKGISWGLIIALIIIVLFQVMLHHTRWGKELKLSGSNKFCAQYAGISQDKNIILTLTLAGLIGGIAGYMIYANPIAPQAFRWSSGANSTIQDGFTGISVSLIAQNSAIGCILSAFLLNMISSAQPYMKVVSSSYNSYITELLSAIIIYIASFASFFRYLIIRYQGKKIEQRNQLNLTRAKPDETTKEA